MSNLYEKIQQALQFIRSKFTGKIELGLILGSGLGDLADEIKAPVIIPFSEIPHFPISTVEGHAGLLFLGELSGKTVASLKGRIHFYEGYSMEQITFPVRVFKALGAEILIVTNACGGVNLSFSPGDLLLIRDHINLMGENPLRGAHDPRLGVRFLDLSEVYDKNLAETAVESAKILELTLREGVHCAVSGPTYETFAELEYLRRIGVDTVGMSTVPEVIVGRHAGLKCLGISCITDVLKPGGGISHEEVLRVAEELKPRFSKLIKETIKRI